MISRGPLEDPGDRFSSVVQLVEAEEVVFKGQGFDAGETGVAGPWCATGCLPRWATPPPGATGRSVRSATSVRRQTSPWTSSPR